MQIKTQLTALLLFSFLLTGMQSRAQKKADYFNAVESLDSVIIQNQRLQIPFARQNRNIEIVDQQTIKTMPVQSVDELLSYVSGVDVRRRGEMGAQADIAVNGGTFDQTLILLNGIKIIDPQTGHNMMMLPVSLEAVDRIEILKGPAASAYGVNAINGAINIVTKQPRKTGVMAHFYGGSSFKKDSLSNHLYTGIDAGAGIGIHTHQARHFLSLNTVQSNGHRHNTAVNNHKLFYTNRFQSGANTLEMMGGYTRHDFGANSFYSTPLDEESRERVQTTIAAVKGKIRIADGWIMRPLVNYRYSDDHYILDKYHPEIYENKHYSNAFNAELNNTFTTGFGTFGLGIEYRNNNITSKSLGNHTRNDLGIFGNYSFTLFDDLLVNAGLYINYNDQYHWHWMPSVDLGYALSSSLRVYANAATGMRQPTYTDLYYAGPVNIGNPDLEPEESWQTEAGLKYKHKNISMAAAYFYRHTDDFIDWVKEELNDPWTTLNYQKTKTHGFSAVVDYDILPQTPTADFSLLFRGSYMYLNPKLGKANDTGRYSNYALENLKHQLIGSLRIGFFNRFTLSVTQRYEKRVNYKDYVLLAARLSGNFHNFEVFADVDNLTDVQYIEAGAIPLAGTWFTLGIKWQYWK